MLNEAKAFAHRVRLLEASFRLDPLVGGVDLAGAGLGLPAHRLGQVAEAVGVMFGNQLAVGALHRTVVRAALDAEHGVGIGALGIALRRHVAATAVALAAAAARAARVPRVAL